MLTSVSIFLVTSILLGNCSLICFIFRLFHFVCRFFAYGANIHMFKHMFTFCCEYMHTTLQFYIYTFIHLCMYTSLHLCIFTTTFTYIYIKSMYFEFGCRRTSSTQKSKRRI